MPGLESIIHPFARKNGQHFEGMLSSESQVVNISPSLFGIVIMAKIAVFVGKQGFV